MHFFVYEKDWIQINPKSTDFKIEENKLKWLTKLKKESKEN